MIGQLAIVLFDGFAFGMLLFVLSVGLSVTLGLMNFVNLAHGAFAMLGGYVAVTVMRQLGLPFLVALPVAFLGGGGRQRRARANAVPPALPGRRPQPGAVHDRSRLRGRSRRRPTSSAPAQQPIQLPAYLRGAFEFAGMRFGAYRLFLIAVALLITRAALFGLERTRFGARVRAAVDNQRVAQGLGLDVDRIFAMTFALGSGLAGLGGALAIEIVGLDPSFGFTYLVYVLIVVAVGGLGSITGSFVGAALLGIGDVAGKYFVPEIGVVPHLPAAGGDAVRAPARPVRKAVSAEMANAEHTRSGPTTGCRRRAAGRPSRSPSGSPRSCRSSLSELSDAGQPDRDRRALRHLGRSVLGYAGIVTLGHADVLRPRRLRGGPAQQGRLGRAADRARRLPRRVAGLRRVRRELHHRARPAPRAGHDHARPRLPDARARQHHAHGSPAATDGLQGVDIWPIFGIFDFDLWGYTAYAYALAVLFVGCSRAAGS